MDLNYSYSAAAGASGAGTTAGNSGQLMAIGNNPSGQPSTINGQNRNQSFSYDDLGRLVSASSWGISQRNYVYDRWGNRTAMSDSIMGVSQSISLQQQPGAPVGVPSNRITSVTNNGVTSNYVYDASGNLTNDGAHSYQYDAENRIAKVDAGTANEASYSYDANNWRVKKVAGGFTAYYIWEGAQVIAEYSNAPAGTGGTSYYLADRLSTRMITDGNGAFKGTQDHLPFGEEAGTSGTTEKHRFTNYERDSETGSDYAINRQYGLGNGRFSQPDKALGFAPQSTNRYSYARNDPVNLSDPTGLLYDLYAWMTDASIHGPGLYIDGIQVLEGQEGLFFGLLSSGAGIIAPFGSTASLGYGGATYISFNTGRTGPNGEIILGTLDIRVEESLSQLIFLNTASWLILDQAINTAITAITRRSRCRDLFVGYIDPVAVLRELRGGRGRGAFGFGSRDANGNSIAANTSAVTTPRFQYTTGQNGTRVNLGTNGADITINTGGPFFTGYNNRFGVSDAVNRAVTVIHELGHALDLIYRNEYTSRIETQNEGQVGYQTSAQNSQLVFRNCFQ
jgi:RHS repeat-associated protein